MHQLDNERSNGAIRPKYCGVKVKQGPAHTIHDGSSRNRAVAKQDKRGEPRGREAYLKQYVDRPNGEPACLGAGLPRPGLSQRRIRARSRSIMKNAG